MPSEIAVLAGGCFWCMEAVFQRIPGVLHVASGFAGGHTEAPSYKEVCTGTTGHAEVLRIEFDPDLVSFATLLEYFFTVHNPTTLNRQGADVGEQYRSAIFYTTEAQRKEALAAIRACALRFEEPIVTAVEPLATFWPAEIEHENYYRMHPEAPYCQFAIAPKLKKAEALALALAPGPPAHVAGGRPAN